MVVVDVDVVVLVVVVLVDVLVVVSGVVVVVGVSSSVDDVDDPVAGAVAEPGVESEESVDEPQAATRRAPTT